MPGITEADMHRINEFVKRTKFERDPELLCPGDDEAMEKRDVGNRSDD
jgi:hypothetical protein